MLKVSLGGVLLYYQGRHNNDGDPGATLNCSQMQPQIV